MKVEPWKAIAFIVSLLVLAGIVNSMVTPPAVNRGPSQIQPASVLASQPSTTSRPNASTYEQAATEKTRTATREATEARTRLISRYTDTSASRTSGSRMVALVAVNENGKLDRAVAVALSSHLKNGTVELLPSFFKPEFVSDGLFDKSVNGSTEVFRDLELGKTLDTLVLARQTVAYTTNPSLENVTTAAMELQVVIIPVNGSDAGQSVPFTATGAGFNQAAARSLAEERLIKQIERDAKLSLSH